MLLEVLKVIVLGGFLALVAEAVGDLAVAHHVF